MDRTCRQGSADKERENVRLRKGEHSLEVDNTRRDIAGGFGFVAFRRGPLAEYALDGTGAEMVRYAHSLNGRGCRHVGCQ